jgi:Fibronectin type III domain
MRLKFSFTPYNVSRFVICILLLVISNVAISQTPVQVTPQLLPPYSLQVSEYYSGTQPKLQVLLLNRDINQPTIQVRLRMTVQSQNCNLRTKDNAVTQVFTLTNGIPYYLQPSELQTYFDPNNLDFSGGYSQQEYISTGRFPEGLYTFTFEAFEVASGNLVSNKGFSLGWLTLADPPLLNTPAKAEGVIPTNPQSIVFNWTPRHNTSPLAGYYTDYIFTIAEYNDVNISPEASFSSAAPLYRDSVQATTYLYGINKPQLVPGKRYTWRVQAKAKSGSQSLAMFKNNGFSEVYWFVYQNNCAAPLGITATVQGQRVSIEWQNNPMHLEWKVEYREKNNPAAQWFSISNTINRVSITDAKPGTLYEYRVGGSCTEGEFTYSALNTFTTAAAGTNSMVNCGDGTVPPAGTGAGLQTLNPGDSIRAGTFKIVVGFSSGTGSFTGMGYTIMPWLANAKVEVKFTNITVSQDYKLMTGVIETTYDPNESGIDDLDAYVDLFTSGYGVGDITSGLVNVDTILNIIIAPLPNGINLPPNFNPSNPTLPFNLTVNPAGGGTPVILPVDKLPFVVQDAAGNIYQVSNNGAIVKVGKAGMGDMFVGVNKKEINSDKAIVTFIEHPNQKYALDSYISLYDNVTKYKKEYEKLGNYSVKNKVLMPGESEKIKATVQIIDSNIMPDSIQFISGKGVLFDKVSLGNNAFEVSIVGNAENDGIELFAIYKNGTTKYNLGKLNCYTYAKKEYAVKVFTFNNAPINIDSIQAGVNRIYNPIGVKITLSPCGNITDNGWDLNGNGLLDATTDGVFQVYSDEMKYINNLVRKQNCYETNGYYFVVVSQQVSPLIAGDMPRDKQIGYLSSGASQAGIVKAAAHELGHGIFKLKHTFDGGDLEKNAFPQNMMDYGTGITYNKYQWDRIHDPAVMIVNFDSDEGGQLSAEDGMLMGEMDNHVSVGTTIVYGKIYRTPAGKPLRFVNDDNIEANSIKYSHCGMFAGAVEEFVSNGKKYIALYYTGSKTFAGYSLQTEFDECKKGANGCTKKLNVFTYTLPANWVSGNKIDLYTEIQNGGDYKKKTTGNYEYFVEKSDVDSAKKYNGGINQPLRTLIESFIKTPILEDLDATNTCRQQTEAIMTSLEDNLPEPENPSAGYSFYMERKTNDPAYNKILLNIAKQINRMGPNMYGVYGQEASSFTNSWGVKEQVEFYKGLKDFNEFYTWLGMQAANIKDQGGMVKYFWELRSKHNTNMDLLKLWNVDDRVHALKTLARGAMWGQGNFTAYFWQEVAGGTGYGAEDFAVDLLQTCPPEDAEKMFTEMVKTDPGEEEDLLYKLIRKIDNSGLGDNNFDKLIDAFYKMFEAKIKANPVDVEKLANEEKAYLWKTTFFVGTPSFKGKIQANGKIKMTWKKVTDTQVNDMSNDFVDSYLPTLPTIPPAGGPVVVPPLQRPEGRMQSQSVEMTKELDPFEPVVIILGENAPNECEAFKGKKMAVVPAVMCDWIWRTNRTKNIKAWVDRGLNLLSMAVGVGVIRSTASTAVKLIAAADVILSGADLLVHESHIQARLAQSAAGRRFLKVFTIMQTAVAITDASVAIKNMGKNAKEYTEAYEAIENTLDGYNDATKTKSIARRFYDEMRSMGFRTAAINSLADVKKYALDIATKAQTKFAQTLDVIEDGVKVIIRRVENGVYVNVIELTAELKLLRADIIDFTKKFKVMFEPNLNLALAGGTPGLSPNRYMLLMEEISQQTAAAKKTIKAATQDDVIRLVRNRMTSQMAELAGENSKFSEIINTLLKGDINDVYRANKLVDYIDANKLSSALAKDLGDSKRAISLEALLKSNPEDIEIYKLLKDNPEKWRQLQKEGFTGLDATSKAKWERWGNAEFFKQVTKAGKDFEDYVKLQLKSKTGKLWDDLVQQMPGSNTADKLADLNSRKILEQVQFCLPGKSVPCNNAGDYFVADFVLVKYNANNQIVDMIVADAKLSLTTPLTKGQKAAKDGAGGVLNVKAEKKVDIFGQELGDLQKLSANKQIVQQKFVEIHGNGAGAYATGGIK